MLAHVRPLSEKLRRDERGGVALLFGLSAVVLMMIAGLAFDFGRVTTSKVKISAAADAAALAAAKAIRLEGLSDDQAIALAKTVFTENMKGGAGNWTDVSSIDVSIDHATSKATIVVASSVKAAFAPLVGIASMGTPGTASAQFDARDIEVGVQLDLTGSMCQPCTKLDDLKDATKLLVEALIPEQPTFQKVRVGFAPFSAGVNVGSYLADVDGNRASGDTCVYERQSSTNAATDAPPSGTDAFKIRSDLSGWVQSCPAAEIEPLTSDRDRLTGLVKDFKTGSSTAGQLGAAWAWYLVSPEWKDVWPSTSRPAPYNDGRTDKVVILMTDGVYNTIGGLNFGDTSVEAETASKLSVDTCTSMKNAGVIVYTVGFDLDSITNTNARTRAVDTLKSCAGRKGSSNAEAYFFKADDGAALKSAFNNIANDIVRLRLTN